ncbi:Tubulin_tyrosine ligase [Hexamita inflata]|uniref:Tubulin--tyrosine ligase-like protein 5 n=1 Tax=Hexamita inflata TaxID=28002 RepID=A0AA86Q8T6_9EUKA|nr:Tubulin tyrosine ligase [Hexamita inflata]
MAERLSKLQISQMNQKEVDRRARLLKSQVGHVILKENIFGDLCVSFKGNQSRDVQQVFETKNLLDHQLYEIVSETSPNNYLYVVYNGKSPHAVRSTLRDAGYIPCERTSQRFNLYWGIVQGPRFYQGLTQNQMVNSFPGQTWFTQKNKLASTINAYQKRTGISNLIPLSFKLQEEHEVLKEYMAKHPDNFFIFKPIFSSRGNNIQLLNHKIEIPSDKEAIVQEYLGNPLLLKGYKFDMRIYVMLFSIEPLAIYIYKEGIGRFCTQKYEKASFENFDNKRIHLTNFEVNRFNQEPKVLYVGETDETQIIELEPGFMSKQSLTEVLGYLDTHRDSFTSLEAMNLPKNTRPGDGALTEKIWEKIKFNVSHVIQASEPYLHYKSRECGLLYQYPRKNFALYGFDIILDENANAYCLEVNVLPSMETTTLFDQKLKFGLLQNTFEMAQPTISVKQDAIVIPLSQELEPEQYSFSRQKVDRNKPLEWDSLTITEQRAIAEITEAEKRLGDFERIQPDGSEEYLDSFEYRRYLNELVGTWIMQNGV